MFYSLIDTVRFRLLWLKYGVIFFKSSDFAPSKIKINGQVVRLCCPRGEESALNYELISIFYEDCYGLRTLPDGIETIVDVGGNIGLFSLASRSFFPKATIHTYEPNSEVQSFLTSHLKGMDIQVFPDAVGRLEGQVEIVKGKDSLHTTTCDMGSGSVRQIAINEVVRRIGGRVHLLKLDCEGAEWAIFDDEQFWDKVDNIVMEYHLFAKENGSILDLLDLIKKKGFRVSHFHENQSLKWGMLHATRV